MHDLPELVVQAIESNQAYAERLQVELRLVERPEHGWALVDPARFIQVMTDLLSNAVKFSPTGAAVEARVTHRPVRRRVEVQDRGSGIPGELRAQVLEKFAQADPILRMCARWAARGWG